MPIHLRVFLSSPGDVAEERRAAREVLTQLPREPFLRGRVTIEVVSWDDPDAPTPLLANEPPQLTVNQYNPRPADCEFTVAILWSKLGTRIPRKHFVKPDGSAFLSGTEWEVDDANQAGKKVFLYRRDEEVRAPIEATDAELEARRAQYRAMKDFIARLSGVDGAVGGETRYKTPAAFRDVFKKHMEAEIRLRLEAADKQAGTNAEGGMFRVFVAEAADDMRTGRNRLLTALGKISDLSLFPAVPPPDERDTHTATVQDFVRRADLCVHFLGTHAGADVIWDEPDATYVLEQARIGLEHGRSRLVLQPQDFAIDKIDNPRYRQFIEALAQRPDDRQALELARVGKLEMLEAVLSKRRAIDAARRRQNVAAAEGTLLDLNDLDEAEAQVLINHLLKRGVNLRMNQTSDAPGSPKAGLDQHAEELQSADHVIVVFGKVTRDWVVRRVDEARKVRVEGGTDAKIGVYVTAPDKPPADLAFPCPVLDNRKGFDPKTLDDFLR